MNPPRFSLAIFALLTATAANAAHLENLQGTVLVNRGQGFQEATAGADLNPGDRVKVVSGAADIVYDHCRTVTVGQGQIIMVVSYTVTNGVCAGGYKDAIAEAPVDSTPDLLIGGLIVGGGVGIGLLVSGNDPASP